MSKALALSSWMLVVSPTNIVGCALNDIGREEVTTLIERHGARRSDIAEQYAKTPVAKSAEARETKPDQMEMRTPVSLREYIVLALSENPDIKEAEEFARSKAERILQVTALPDPALSTKTLPEPVRTAEGDNFFILGVSQKLPVPRKLDRAGRMALEETRMAQQRLLETRLRVIADVKRTYFQLYVLDKTLRVTRENQELMSGLIDVARAQVATGRRPQDDALRALVELSNLESELIALRQRRATAAAMLNQLLNRPATTPLPSPEDFEIRRTQLSIEKLFARAVEMNPALEQLRRQVARDRQAVELAKLAYWPEFVIGFEWMPMEPRDAFRPPPNPQTGVRPVVSQLSEEGTDNWAIVFGFSLPIWYDKIEAGIKEARHRLSASRQQLASMENRVAFQVTDALERVRAQEHLADLFRNTIIPQAEQTYRVSQASYAAGSIDFLYVIDNWRKWLVFTIQYYRSLGELERSVADLEQVLGLSLQEVGAAQ